MLARATQFKKIIFNIFISVDDKTLYIYLKSNYQLMDSIIFLFKFIFLSDSCKPNLVI